MIIPRAIGVVLVATLVGLCITRSNSMHLPTGFVNAIDVVPSLIVEMRYSTMHNFIGSPVMGYDGPHCILTEQAAMALAIVQQDLLAQNLSLKVYDCYRPVMAVDQFVQWSSNPDILMQGEFYPSLTKDVLFPDGYIAANSSHSRGSTVDITIIPLPPGPQDVYTRGDPLYPCYAPLGTRFKDNSLDMGTGFDCFNELAFVDAINISADAYKNRMFLQGSMIAAGFNNYEYEWWHFTLANEPYPNTYFNFPIPY